MSSEPVVSDRILTVPNLLSLLRLLRVPVFAWAIITRRRRPGVRGARRQRAHRLPRRLPRPPLNQTSRLGQILDPVADRLYILAVVIGLALRDIIPWWVRLLAAAARPAAGGLVPLLRTRGYSALPVHFLGKAATFNLLYAFPLLLLGDGDGRRRRPWPRSFGWAFASWGIGLYWWAGILYASGSGGRRRARCDRPGRDGRLTARAAWGVRRWPAWHDRSRQQPGERRAPGGRSRCCLHAVRDASMSRAGWTPMRHPLDRRR